MLMHWILIVLFTFLNETTTYLLTILTDNTFTFTFSFVFYLLFYISNDFYPFYSILFLSISFLSVLFNKFISNISKDNSDIL